MDFEKLAQRYRTWFDQTLRRFRHPFTQEFGVDYYGVPEVRTFIEDLPAADRAAFVSLLFLDALFDAAGHAHAKAWIAGRFFVAEPFILNSYNFFTTPAANLSHRHPQCLLGLLTSWTDDDRKTLMTMTRRRLADLRSGLGDQYHVIVRALADDEHLTDTDFSPLGVRVPNAVRDAYVAELRSAADQFGSP